MGEDLAAAPATILAPSWPELPAFPHPLAPGAALTGMEAKCLSTPACMLPSFWPLQNAISWSAHTHKNGTVGEQNWAVSVLIE